MTVLLYSIQIALAETLNLKDATSAAAQQLAMAKMNVLRFGVPISSTTLYFSYTLILKVLSVMASFFLFLLGISISKQ